DLTDRPPLRRAAVARLMERDIITAHQGDMSDRGNSGPAIPARITECGQLLEIPVARIDARLVGQRTPRCRVEGLILVHQHPGKRDPSALRPSAPHEQHLPRLLDRCRAQREHDNIYREESGWSESGALDHCHSGVLYSFRAKIINAQLRWWSVV